MFLLPIVNTHRWFNVGPLSATLAQHWNVGYFYYQMYITLNGLRKWTWPTVGLVLCNSLRLWPNIEQHWVDVSRLLKKTDQQGIPTTRMIPLKAWIPTYSAIIHHSNRIKFKPPLECVIMIQEIDFTTTEYARSYEPLKINRNICLYHHDADVFWCILNAESSGGSRILRAVEGGRFLN